MESRVSGNAHARFGVGENPEVVRQRITYHYRIVWWHFMIWIVRGDPETLPRERGVSSVRATRTPLFMCTAM